MKPTNCPVCGRSVEPGHEVMHDCTPIISERVKEVYDRPKNAADFAPMPRVWETEVMGSWERRPRTGNWMQTFTGRMFWPLDPRPEEIFIEDIAHALSHYCRFGGHCKTFYSVAEHSLFVANLVPAKDRLHALLHDAAEAYLGDMINPLKRTMPEYERAEHAVWLAVCQRFNISPCLPTSVRIADRIAVMTERRDICSTPPASWGAGFEDVPPAVAEIRPAMFPEKVKGQFLERFHRISREITA